MKKAKIAGATVDDLSDDARVRLHLLAFKVAVEETCENYGRSFRWLLSRTPDKTFDAEEMMNLVKTIEGIPAVAESKVEHGNV